MFSTAKDMLWHDWRFTPVRPAIRKEVRAAANPQDLTLARESDQRAPTTGMVHTSTLYTPKKGGHGAMVFHVERDYVHTNLKTTPPLTAVESISLLTSVKKQYWATELEVSCMVWVVHNRSSTKGSNPSRVHGPYCDNRPSYFAIICIARQDEPASGSGIPISTAIPIAGLSQGGTEILICFLRGPGCLQAWEEKAITFANQKRKKDKGNLEPDEKAGYAAFSKGRGRKP
ncbi:uncharacterized protein PGRI_050160 [Penicillium griseofulvum]|uniref:Uncharacterized protein n=1 Tax=Penicillium patulum TaxID=5078 RepID=A0A135LBE3_PENPA|nr:uncharacterized protein PGRI_050160 [Penicillium griseofulvum]KXG46160.1 hypothetical protein PGRI_050160 [Penicillium griseofulvum]